MEKRVIIVHGWAGKPNHGWYPWLAKELERKGFEVQVPELPNTQTPKISPWVSTLASVVSDPNENTYLVGHSIGCQTILRYLETLSGDQKVGGVIFVAGFFTLQGLEEGEPEIAAPWLETPIDTDKVRMHLDKSIAIFSSDDPYVPLENQKYFQDKVGSETILLENMGHFTEEDGTRDLPIVLEKLLEMAK